MKESVRILLVEDLPSDAQLADYEISKIFKDYILKVVETEADFISHMEEFLPDIIISDYQLPEFDGMSALKIVLEKSPFTPVIILTGSMNEDTAVECMKAGAVDYVIKEHIKRLGSAMINALEQKEVKLQRNRMEQQLRESEEKFRTLFQNHAAVKLLINPESGKIVDANDAAAKFYGWSAEELKSMDISGINALLPEEIQALIKNAARTKNSSFELKHIKADGSDVAVEVFSSKIIIGDTEYLHFIIHDITERKIAQDRIIRSLYEKENLLKEIFHRTNNNMLLIQSMLLLQSAGHPHMPLAEFVDIMRQRIDAMSLVHKKLYASKNLSRIDLGDYLSDLTARILEICRAADRGINISMNLRPIPVLFDTVVPVGLVVHELLTNAVRFAFPEKEGGR